MKHLHYLLLTLLLFPCLLFSQSATNQKKSLLIKQVVGKIQIDGILDEAAWEDCELATDFRMTQPVDDKPANKRTEVKMAYDDRFVYISAVCWDDPDYVIQTLKRDGFGDSDEFGVFIDPLAQQTNGYGFGISALGAQSEALIVPVQGLFDDAADSSWDNKWFGAVQQYPDRWTVEMAIPFKTLRFKAGQGNWNINFVRIEPGLNETYAWSPVPRQFFFGDIGYYGNLEWEKAPEKAGANVSLIPYARIGLNQDASKPNGEKNDWNGQVGGDAKVAITPTLNLDLTFNPDFSQVEVDAQVTNLTRFNIFFPERRQFFLENADIFSNYGQFANRPFYSRRIGLDNSGQTVPILYGARLSGNLNENLRIGAFNMHTQSTDNGLAQNYTAANFQRRIWKRSEIKGFFLNRQAFDGGETLNSDYGRNFGGEFGYSTPDGKWQSTLGFIQSLKEGFDEKNKHIYSSFSYNGTNFRTFTTFQNLGENYFADMGFNARLNNFNPETNEIVRVGYSQLGNFSDYYYYPENSAKINYHWSGLENFVWFNPDASINEWYTRLRHFIFFKNTSQLRFRLNNNYVDLLFPFALTDIPLPATDYNMTEFNIQFNTDLRKTLNTEMFIVYGQFFSGNKLTYRGELTYRVQPWGNFSLGLERNDIWLPDPYGELHLTLATGRFEVNFSTNLFWTTFLQYNTQADNFNINSRFQWRFAPMSDLFLVYTDNYAVENLFGPKTRSLVLKMNYWLTL